MARSEQQGLQVLSALDAAKTQWYHFTAIVVAGMGFFTDAYDLFTISLVTKLLGRIYTDLSKPDPGSLPPASPPPSTASPSAAPSPASSSSAGSATRWAGSASMALLCSSWFSAPSPPASPLARAPTKA
ncbi:hypothetical protein ZWY2020_047255 [Hordeum vulgare]|nr:hypothetical protein ZWY2020_047255 [Hordeum vulgare]